MYRTGKTASVNKRINIIRLLANNNLNSNRKEEKCVRCEKVKFSAVAVNNTAAGSSLSN